MTGTSDSHHRFDQILQSMRFKFPWRDYQQRVLDELDRHLDDSQLHVVAAPGSGKTVLGLEVLRRLGKPAIVFAPTLTIRQQWKSRLTELFLPDGTDDSWISLNIREVKPVTIVTYQGFHAAMTGTPPEAEDGNGWSVAEKLVQQFRDLGVGTLVFDEAHHLRKEWHQSLMRLRQALADETTTVSLTATPPYDTDAAEWDNYEALCGPIDCEISVPELVKTGDLCPHQDLVCFSAPTADETSFINAFANNLNGFAQDLLTNAKFLDRLENLPWFRSPADWEEELFRQADVCLAALVFLTAAGRSVSPVLLELFSLDNRELPGLDREFLEHLLNGVLNGEMADRFEPGLRKDISRKLKAFGGMRGKRAALANMDRIDRMLRNSLGKIQSIRSIVAAECSSLGNRLRMVILTDHIHRDLQPSDHQAVYEPVKIGAVPVFEVLRNRGDYAYEVGLLTGSYVVLPAKALELLQTACGNAGLSRDDLRLRPLAHDPAYVEVELTASVRHLTVPLMTEVFRKGGVTVLVGTQALLGEGWDAPCINSLVLASTVGSFMLSNQMRGRAIRKDPEDSRKTANVWHLACVKLPDTSSVVGKVLETGRQVGRHFRSQKPLREDLGQDAVLLVRRFKAFEGLSMSDPPYIETGLGRLGFAETDWSEEALDQVNGATFARSADRAGLTERWKLALFKSSAGARLRPMAAVRRAPQSWVYRRARRMGGVILPLLVLAVAALAYSLWAQKTMTALGAVVVLLLTLFLAKKENLHRTVPRALRNRSVEQNLSQIGKAVLEALSETGQLKTPLHQLKPAVHVLHGEHFCSLDGADPKEQALFLKCLEQLLSPVENPRYILLRQVCSFGQTRTDYHPVPDALGARKIQAETLARCWQRFVSDVELVSVRSREGRRLLLGARMETSSADFCPQAERLGRWL
ncbi:DEAD/DEAH box helicase family protein [Roseibium sp.]|uniref:DEAD/DEAH box helicase family protein n=1 Tax=Roseibium sp. TaxID=1936156 RepID=UPI003BB214B4